jgi:hypothetical protein
MTARADYQAWLAVTQLSQSGKLFNGVSSDRRLN